MCDFLKFEIGESAPVQYDDEDFCWFHPRVAAVPGRDRQGGVAAVMTLQKHLNVSDYYSGMPNSEEAVRVLRSVADRFGQDNERRNHESLRWHRH